MSKSELKYLDRYTCEFNFIPNVLTSLYIQGVITDDFILNPIKWKRLLPIYGFSHDFGLSKITVKKSGSEESKKAKFLITFPKPNIVPNCFYAILYIDKRGYDYYTLELDFGSSVLFKSGGGIICGQKGSLHLNYGRRCKEDLDEFEKMVQDIIDGKKYDNNDMMKDIDYQVVSKEFGMSEKEFKEKCDIF